MTLTLYTHPAGLTHDTGPGHPECAARLQVILDLFDEAPFNSLPRVTAREAEYEELLRAHDERYLERLQEAIPERRGEMRALDNDTIVSNGSWLAASHAAGAVCQAVDDIAAGNTMRAFCAGRPPGHHAFPDHAEGFCLLNNVMIGALHAQARGFTKIAIADFDVHHGNGTDAMARRHPNIFYASTHQWPLYPGTGLPGADVPGRIANRTLAAGDGPAEFRTAWADHLLPQLNAFTPDLLIISAGFDAHRDDPLAQINLVEADFGWITGELVAMAERCCSGKVVSVLEGGYDLEELKASVTVHLKALD